MNKGYFGRANYYNKHFHGKGCCYVSLSEKVDQLRTRSEKDDDELDDIKSLKDQLVEKVLLHTLA